MQGFKKVNKAVLGEYFETEKSCFVFIFAGRRADFKARAILVLSLARLFYSKEPLQIGCLSGSQQRPSANYLRRSSDPRAFPFSQVKPWGQG